MDARSKAASLAIWGRPVEPEPVGGGITNPTSSSTTAAPLLRAHRRRHPRAHDPALARARRQPRRPCRRHLARGAATPSRACWSSTSSRAARCTPEDVRDRRQLERHRRPAAPVPPRDAPPPARARRSLFWVFHVAARLRRTPCATAPAAMASSLPARSPAPSGSKRAVGPVELVFGHNDLLAANIIDDGSRLWLVDWDYAGFNSPLFDLGGLASNSELPGRRARLLLEAYFERPARPTAAPPRRGHDCRLAAARGDVEHGLRAPLHASTSTIAAYTAENLRPLRDGLGRLRGMIAHDRLPTSARVVIIGGGIVGCSAAYHLGQAGLDRGAAARAAQAHRPARPGMPPGWSASSAPAPTSPSSSAIRSRSTTGWRRRPGLATGWKTNGGLRLACNAERWTEVKRQATTARSLRPRDAAAHRRRRRRTSGR